MNKQEMITDLRDLADTAENNDYEYQAVNLREIADALQSKRNIFDRIKVWNEERLLDKQEFSLSNELTNIMEELFELRGIKIHKKNRETFKTNLVTPLFRIDEDPEVIKRTLVQDDELVENTIKDQLDALADIVVFAVGAMIKLKADPNCVMDETLKEIESRTGKIIDGKFVKDLTGNGYIANYELCLKDKNVK